MQLHEAEFGRRNALRLHHPLGLREPPAAAGLVALCLALAVGEGVCLGAEARRRLAARNEGKGRSFAPAQVNGKARRAEQDSGSLGQ